MSIRCYRAATMREALEKIKSELGEEALVLDTRRVRARRWFGFGGREMVEVRVAEPKTSKRDERERNKRSYYVEREGLRLLDDSPAMPTVAAATERRATERPLGEPVRSEQPKREARPVRGPALDLGDLLRAKSEPEIGAERPRKSNGDASASVEKTHAVEAERQNGMARSALTAELERLRAELREVKFALGAFAARADGRSLGEGDARPGADDEPLDPPFYEAYLELTAIGLTPEYARRVMRAALALNLTEAGGNIADMTRSALVYTLNSVVQFASDPLAQESEEASPVVAFIGPTGVGKTTTIAKLAARVALRARRRVDLITLDTYRIAAIEQLRTYAEIIGAGFHVAHSTIELDALIQRRTRGTVCIIDTVGRSPHDLADQMELADYLRANDEIVKCLVLQATMHPVDALAAAKKFALYGANRLALTKLDETSRPGAAAVIAADARVPLTYLCAGQRVPEDLEQASAESFALRILRASFGKEGR